MRNCAVVHSRTPTHTHTPTHMAPNASFVVANLYATLHKQQLVLIACLSDREHVVLESMNRSATLAKTPALRWASTSERKGDGTRFY